MAGLDDSPRYQIAELNQDDVENLERDLAIPKLLAQSLVATGYRDANNASAYLYATLETAWLDPARIAHLTQVVERIEAAIDAEQTIAIFGDYDVDGISATAILTQALIRLGARAVHPFIPLRQGEGYGMSRPALDRLLSECTPNLVITVDNGIANAREVDLLAQQGIEVIVTDHHEPGEEVPAHCIVCDPKLDANGPSRSLAGAGVVLKVAQALFERRGLGDAWHDLTDLATLGTIADYMPLDAENRALVKCGMERIRATARPGIAALAEVANADLAHIEAHDLSFSLIPRLNAAGRMNDPKVSLDLLLAKDASTARSLAHTLNTLNSERRALESKESALAISLASQLPPDSPSIVVWSKDFHDGVKGIVASRVMQRFQKPTLIFSVNEDGTATGSGRSCGNLDLFSALSKVAHATKRFGGHAQAVGATVEAQKLPEFKAALDAALAQLSTHEQAMKEQVVAEVDVADLTVRAIDSLDELKPFGSQNPEPLFCMKRMLKQNPRPIGARQNHAAYSLKDASGAQIECVQFTPQNMDEILSGDPLVDVVFSPQVDTWRGECRPKLFVKELIPRNASLVAPEPEDAPTKELVDGLFSRATQILNRDDYASVASAESFFTKVVGITFEGRQEIAKQVVPGMELTLKREPQNEFDPCAIALLTPTGEQVGYVRKEIAQHIAPQIDDGTQYEVRVQEVTGATQKGQSLGINIEVARVEPDAQETGSQKDAATQAKAQAKELARSLATCTSAQLTDQLRARFIGENALLPAQARALELLGEGKNVLCVMATGRGKSLIFHIHAAKVALQEHKASVFVFPLRALVNDQAYHLDAALSELGITVARLTGESTPEERADVIEGLEKGSVHVVLTTPEYLAIHTQDFVQSGRVGFVVLDESHHAGESKGGNRGAYQQMPRVLEELGHPTTLAVTATATTESAQEIVRLANIDATIKDATCRENLHIKDARGTKDRETAVLAHVAEGEKCVIYVNSKDQSVALARMLRKAVPSLGARIAFYNASLTREERRAIEEAFRAGKLRTIVSTSAFGEGVNIGDIRHVMLYHMPFGEVEFNQMSGRAGRDGKDAYIHLLFGQKDAFINEHILGSLAPKRDSLAALYKTLVNLSGELVEPGETTFRLENEAIAQQVNTTFPAANLDVSSVSAGIGIFRELGFLQTHGFSKARRIEMLANPEKKELSASSRFTEGLKSKESFFDFKAWVMSASADELLAHINRPITPAFGEEIA